MLHIYHGDGKGKTTAAMGLALRALGRGWRVHVAQFLKDGTSGEVAPLRRLGAEVLAVDMGGRFTFQMDEAELLAVRAGHEGNLERLRGLASDAATGARSLVVLDEALDAIGTGTLGEDRVLAALDDLAAAGIEVVVTGRNPSDALLARADYVTEMRAAKHPYARGVGARAGVEF